MFDYFYFVFPCWLICDPINFGMNFPFHSLYTFDTFNLLNKFQYCVAFDMKSLQSNKIMCISNSRDSTFNRNVQKRGIERERERENVVLPWTMPITFINYINANILNKKLQAFVRIFAIENLGQKLHKICRQH